MREAPLVDVGSGAAPVYSDVDFDGAVRVAAWDLGGNAVEQEVHRAWPVADGVR